MYPKGQFKKIAKHGKFMEDSKIKLISQNLDTNLILKIFSQIKKEFWWGAPYGKHA